MEWRVQAAEPAPALANASTDDAEKKARRRLAMYYFPGDFVGLLRIAGMVILIWRHRNTRFFQVGAAGMGLLASAGSLAWEFGGHNT